MILRKIYHNTGGTRNMKTSDIITLKVSSKSNPNSVAGAIVATVRENGFAEVQSVGAGALNQAVKAVAIARGFVAPSGIDLICSPSFQDVEIAGENRTAMRLIVEQIAR